MRRYAVLSDIHGNVRALDTVLADVERRDVHAVLDLGDTLYGPLEPQAVAERLMALPVLHVRGNEDRLLLEPPASAASSPSLGYTLGALAPQALAWLASRPATRVVDEDLFLCHGTPGSDETYLLESLAPDGAKPSDTHEVEARLAGVAQSVVLCGHSHLPRAVRAGARLVVNPGSVGLPAYADDGPVPHKMESGSPHARYAVLTVTAEGASVEHVALAYDWEAAATQARRNGRPDWAAWLATGRS